MKISKFGPRRVKLNLSTKAQTAMSLSFGGDLEPFSLSPSSADVISVSLRTCTHSEVLEKRRTPIVSRT